MPRPTYKIFPGARGFNIAWYIHELTKTGKEVYNMLQHDDHELTKLSFG